MSCPHPPCRDHRVLPYDSSDAFAAAIAPLVRDAVAAGDPVLVATGDENARALRAALDGDAGRVDVRSPADWYSTPPRVLAAIGDRVAHTEDRRLLAIGEIPFDGGLVEPHEWIRYEAVLDTAFAEIDATLVCPYDLRIVDGAILEHAHRTHPFVQTPGEALVNDAYEGGDGVLAALDAERLPDPPSGAETLPIEDTPGTARRFVTDRARAAGIDGERLEDLRVAVTEIVTNALVHGLPPRRVGVWSKGGTFVCEVRDAGAGIPSGSAGFVIPDAEGTSGRGVWIARQVCDLVQVRGAQVRLHMRAG